MPTKLFYRTWQANIKIYTEEQKDKNYHDNYEQKDQTGNTFWHMWKLTLKLQQIRQCNSGI